MVTWKPHYEHLLGSITTGGEEKARCLHAVDSHQGLKNGKRGSLHFSSFLFFSVSQIQQIIELFTVLSSWSLHHREHAVSHVLVCSVFLFVCNLLSTQSWLLIHVFEHVYIFLKYAIAFECLPVCALTFRNDTT